MSPAITTPAVRPRRRLALVLVALAAAAGVGAAPCTIDRVPAATLLIPYFEVDPQACSSPPPFSAYRTTRVRITNVAAAPVLTRVTVWSNLGVPVAGFNLYLQGYDMQSLDLADIVCGGAVPQTGPTTSPLGQYSDPAVSFPNCGDPVASDLGPATTADLLAYLRGASAPGTGLCAGLPAPPPVTSSNMILATGYLTIDVVSACSALSPATSTYHASVIGYQNVLAGEYDLVDPANNFAEGFAAVAIEAAPAVFANGDVTFYGRYDNANASDAREPLGTTYRTPYTLSGVFDATDVFVWRETTKVEQPFPCGTVPSWYPLDSGKVLAFPEEDGAHLGAIPAHGWLPLASQRVAVGSPAMRLHPASSPYGWLYLDLQHDATIYGATPHTGQAWVTSRRMALGRFAVGADGIPLDSACTSAPFVFTAPPRTDFTTTPEH